MKFFGKELSGKAARDLIMRLVLIVVSGAVLIVSTVTTVAWFTRNTTVRNTGMQVVVKTDNYKIIINRTTEYDKSIYTERSDISGLKTKLGTEGLNLIATKTSDSRALAYELVNEDEDTTEHTKYLRPGSFGTLTFYIQTSADISVPFALSLGGYANDYDNEENAIIAPVMNETYLNYLKGHLLFFMGRDDTNGHNYDDFVYSGFVCDSFTYNTGENSYLTSQEIDDIFDGCSQAELDELHAEHCYEVVLYWEWPLTYSDISDNISTTDPAVTKKYPADVGTYLNTYKSYNDNGDTKSYFLAKNLSSSAPQELNDGYNDADQLIGDHIDYVVVYLE